MNVCLQNYHNQNTNTEKVELI